MACNQNPKNTLLHDALSCVWSALAVVPPPSCADIVDSVVQCMHNAEALPSVTALSITHPCLGPIRESKAPCASTAWRDAVHDAASILSPSVAVRCTKGPGLHSSDGGGGRGGAWVKSGSG
jgi:hypothetical protein